jgi:hypothetical protein
MLKSYRIICTVENSLKVQNTYIEFLKPVFLNFGGTLPSEPSRSNCRRMDIGTDT